MKLEFNITESDVTEFDITHVLGLESEKKYPKRKLT